jgi:2-methylcitrate dehydratase PrpD
MKRPPGSPWRCSPRNTICSASIPPRLAACSARPSLLRNCSASTPASCFPQSGSLAAWLEFLSDGAWTKRLHPGLAAQNGIQAALLAAEGFRGPSRILEGRDGFLHGYSRHPLPDLLTSGLGESFEILRTSVKPHACCRYMQGPIDAILALVHEHDIRPEQVSRIEVAVLEAGWPLVVEPRAQKYDPRSIVEAQFSMPYGAAVAVIDRAAGLDQFNQARLQCTDVRGFLDKVVMIKNSDIEKTFPAEWPAVVTIHLADGRRFEKMIRHPKGDPQNPLSWPELITKFRGLAGAVLPPDRCEKIVAEVSNGDRLAGLPALCTPYEN